MIEPLYRGKRIDTGEWAYGYFAKYMNIKAQVYSAILIFDEETGDVYSDGITPIEEDSRCEYTGLTDKNGNKIFECDIVRDEFGKLIVVRIGEHTYEEEYGDSFVYYGVNIMMGYGYGEIGYCNYEVIGNIYDNPELLEN